MHVIVAPDSFKGSLSAVEVAECIATAVTEVFPSATIEQVPMADGGEGTVEALLVACGGERRESLVTDPLGHKVSASWGILADGTTAVIEMAAASGLTLVSAESRNPLYTTTYGTGELIREALDAKCTHLIIGIGGSATNDGGAGMAQALGARFLDAAGKELEPGGLALQKLQRIDISNLDPRLKAVKISVACDVNNPLYGPRGAASIYGPQKGATTEMISQLDLAMERYATVLQQEFGQRIADIPGAGAAGGLGAGLMVFAGSHLLSGIDIIADLVKLDQRLRRAHMVITGEGRLDDQTYQGKALHGIAVRARAQGVPVFALVGGINGSAKILCGDHLRAALSIVSGPMTVDSAISKARDLLTEAAMQALRLIKIGIELNQAGVEE